jgi:hypothetical protein
MVRDHPFVLLEAELNVIQSRDKYIVRRRKASKNVSLENPLLLLEVSVNVSEPRIPASDLVEPCRWIFVSRSKHTRTPFFFQRCQVFMTIWFPLLLPVQQSRCIGSIAFCLLHQSEAGLRGAQYQKTNALSFILEHFLVFIGSGTQEERSCRRNHLIWNFERLSIACSVCNGLRLDFPLMIIFLLVREQNPR